MSPTELRGISRAMAPRLGRWRAGITPTVVVLGLISLLTDVASEMVAPLRLLFLVQVLGAPLAAAGLIEGVAEGATSLVRIASGRLADRLPSRRGLVTLGYALSNLTRPLLARTTSWLPALALVVADRAGKAIRVSPRDAILADAAPSSQRGKVFGFHRGADTLGAAFGPLLAFAILADTGGQLRVVLAWTLVPGSLAVLVAVLFLRDPRRERQSRRPDASPGSVVGKRGARPARPARQLGMPFWLFTAAATCFALGNSSDAFLFLRAEGLEASLLAVPLLYVGFNLAYAALATPVGALSDRWGRLPVLMLGYAAFTVVYLGWTRTRGGWPVVVLFLVYAVYYAATEGVARAYVADLVPQSRRGTALGWFNGLTGMAALPANLMAAWLWSAWGPGATFALGAWLGAVALGLLVAWWPWLSRAARPGVVPAASADDGQTGVRGAAHTSAD